MINEWYEMPKMFYYNRSIHFYYFFFRFLNQISHYLWIFHSKISFSTIFFLFFPFPKQILFQMHRLIQKPESFCWKLSTFCWITWNRKMIEVNVSWNSIIRKRWRTCWIWTYQMRQCHCNNWSRTVPKPWNIKFVLVSENENSFANCEKPIHPQIGMKNICRRHMRKWVEWICDWLNY